MVELIRTNDVVLLSFLQAVLRDDGIETLVLDEHTSVVEGSLGMLPRRVMVLEEDEDRARYLLDQVENSHAWT